MKPFIHPVFTLVYIMLWNNRGNTVENSVENVDKSRNMRITTVKFKKSV